MKAEKAARSELEARVSELQAELAVAGIAALAAAQAALAERGAEADRLKEVRQVLAVHELFMMKLAYSPCAVVMHTWFGQVRLQGAVEGVDSC